MFVMLDGRMLTDQPTDGAQFTLKGLERGEHNLSVVVRDAAGKVACAVAPGDVLCPPALGFAPANPQSPANQARSVGQPAAHGHAACGSGPAQPPPPPIRPR